MAQVTIQETPMMDDPLSQPLMRVRQGKLIGGVCGGIAKWLGWDPTLVRIGYVILSVLSVGFPGLLIYILLWILMPLEPA
jgi:phage shock protein C